MRNTLILLSSLALAAAASAAPYSFGASTSSVSATYTMDAGVTLVPGSIVHEEYYPQGFAPGPNYSDLYTGDPTGPTNAAVTYAGATTADVSTTGGAIHMTADSNLRLDPAVNTQDTYVQAKIAHRTYLTFDNATGGDAQVHFTFDRSGGFSGHADRPSNPAGDFLWDYAGGEAGGGIGEVDDESDVITPDGDYEFDNTFGWTYDFGTGVVQSDLGDSFDLQNQSIDFTLGAGTHRFEIWTFASPEVGYANPVPEPSAFAALGLGGLALLRRRNRR